MSNFQKTKEPNKETYSILSVNEIKGTPFNSVRTKAGYYLCIGKYRISDKTFISHDHAASSLKTIDYMMLLSIMQLVCDQRLIEHKLIENGKNWSTDG